MNFAPSDEELAALDAELVVPDVRVMPLQDVPAGWSVAHPNMPGRSARWTGEIRNGMAVLDVSGAGLSFVHPDERVAIV